MKRKTYEDYVNELKIKNPNVEVIDKYINAKTPVLHRCLIHDVIWNTSPDGVLQGAGCENCRRDKLHEHHQKTHAQYVQDLSIKNPNIKVIDEYIDCHTPILHHCEVHDVDWRIAPNNALQGGGCSMCKSNKIAKALKKTHNEYVQELADAKPYISVVDLYVDANTQIQLDFYISELNICIEYQGQQHYQPVNFGGISDEDAYNNFLTIQCHDEIKKNYCDSNGIKLIYVPYWENVDEFLNKNLLI